MIQQEQETPMTPKATLGSTLAAAALLALASPALAHAPRTATADVIWTGIVTATPHFAEQGKEHDDRVKVKGEWMITKRIITSTGGLAPFFQATYIDR